MKVFNLTYSSPDSTQGNRKTIITTKGFLFRLEKNIHFYLISLPGLTRRPNDNHCKLVSGEHFHNFTRDTLRYTQCIIGWTMFP